MERRIIVYKSAITTPYPASGSKQYKNKNKNKQTISITQMALKNGMVLKINTKGVCT